jgi:integrase
MDALITAAKRRKRPRDIAIFLILRDTGMRRESVASLRMRHLDSEWGLRGVYTKGGKDPRHPAPLGHHEFPPDLRGARARPRSRRRHRRHTALLVPVGGAARRAPGHADHRQEPLAALQDVRSADRCARAQASRLAARGRDGGPRAAPRPRAGPCALGHTRIDTTQIYATIRPAQLKRAVAFYEDKAARMLSG